MTVDFAIHALVRYAVSRGMLDPADAVWAKNGILSALSLSDLAEESFAETEPSLTEILGTLLDDAAARGVIEDTVTYRDLLDTSLMGLLMPRPSETVRRFEELYRTSPEAATDWFYRLMCDSNYIRVDRISRDMKWSVPSRYGEIDITVNLSKPEKDPRAIAAAKLLPQSGYPKCLLCHENEGYAGNAAKPARQNLRQIPFDMAGVPWYLQYSPYVYYNEHCIALSSRHEPMKIDRSTFSTLLDFVSVFPHYFIGSNADLPIVGGSILSHDHMQGGRYTFAREKAEIEIPLSFSEFPGVRAGIVNWPMAVIRIASENKAELAELADRILTAWRAYSDPEAEILAESEGEPHNTVTPIARRRGEAFELDLVLRNNRTSKEHPFGIFHPHEELHNIKKENIGLIEVMGLAVLPARLKDELIALADCLVKGSDPSADPMLEKHAAWVEGFRSRYTFTEENALQILKDEVGATFVRVLEHAGVYAATPEGRAAFLRFIAKVNE